MERWSAGGWGEEGGVGCKTRGERVVEGCAVFCGGCGGAGEL